ncbi:MAG: UvrD-helicase domain-containing protein [Chloroflexota bacterium]
MAKNTTPPASGNGNTPDYSFQQSFGFDPHEAPAPTAGPSFDQDTAEEEEIIPEEPAWMNDLPLPEAASAASYDLPAPRPAFQPDPAQHEKIVAGLNKQQREAVETTSGPLLIIAGPGSGKTRVLTHRIAYLMEVEGVWPSRICAVTFTNKAASEMKLRLERLIGPRVRELTIGTFHSLGVRILRQDADAIGYKRDFAIYDDDDQLSLVKQAIKDIGLDEKMYPPRGFLSRISDAKAVLASPEQALRQAENYREELAARIYRRYQELLQSNKAMDFDDLIKLTIELFTERPDILRRYQERFLHVLVDEYQDTSHSQYVMIKLLSSIHKNLCVVGDDDQSVYGWRAADIRNILDFERDYPNAKVIVLGQNYRSTQTILKVAEEVIKQNAQRKHKDLWTENESGLPITLFEAYNETEEAQYIARETMRLTTSGYSYKDIAVMYRTNAQSREIEQACMLYKVPYQLVGGVRFYSRKEVKDVLSILRIVHNPESNVDLMRMINNTPMGKGIGSKTVTELDIYATKLGLTLYQAMHRAVQDSKRDRADNLPPGTPVFSMPTAKFVPLLSNVEEMIASRDDLPVVGLLDLLLAKTGYQEFLQDGTQEGEERWQNVMELRTVAENYADLSLSEQLGKFLEDVALMSDIDTLKEEKDAVTLITLHAAKGLEFPVVFIAGMDEGILPHSRALEAEEAGRDDQMEEERRLAYVGITRAKQRLYMVYAFRRTLYGMTQTNGPSRFIADVPPDLVTGRDPGTAFNPARTTGGKMSTIPEKGLTAEDILKGNVSIYGKGASRTNARPGLQPSTPGLRPGSYRTEKRRDDVRDQRNTRLNITSGSDLRDRKQGNPPAPSTATNSFKVGDRVRHSTFGEGQILAAKPTTQDQELTVMFKSHGTKRLLASAARLEKL